MDQSIDKMKLILKEVTRRQENEKISREQLLDYQQEIYRQYAILSHFGRAYKNTPARAFGFAAGSVLGYLYGANHFSVQQKGLKVQATLIGYSLVGGAIGYYMFSRHFGSRSEYTVYRNKKLIADGIYDKFQ